VALTFLTRHPSLFGFVALAPDAHASITAAPGGGIAACV